jgi:hypothetical protein
MLTTWAETHGKIIRCIRFIVYVTMCWRKLHTFQTIMKSALYSCQPLLCCSRPSPYSQSYWITQGSLNVTMESNSFFDVSCDEIVSCIEQLLTGFGFVIGLNGLVVTALDYTRYFTVTYTLSVHSQVFTNRFLVAASIADVPFLLGFRTKFKLFCDWQLVGQFVLVSNPHLGPTTRFLLMSHICGLDVVVSIMCAYISLSLSDPISAERLTIIYCIIWDSPNLEG